MWRIALSVAAQYKITFLSNKTDSSFLKEMNKHNDRVDITDSDDGSMGRVALEKLCNNYLSRSDFDLLKNAQKWCTLRIMDKEISGKNWISLESADTEEKWKTSFESNKNLLVSLKINGITDATDKNSGYSIVREWCSRNTKLAINKNNKETEENAYKLCAESSTST